MPAESFLRPFLFRLCLITLASAGCARERSKLDVQPPPAGSTAPTPGATAPTTPQAPPAANADGISGTVVETMDAGGYTYAKLDRGGTQVWVAGPETKLAVGQTIGNVTGTLMTGFHSTTLNRTFDEIYFVNALTVTGMAGPNPHTAGAAAAAAAAAEPIEKVAPAPGGKTIADLFANKATLAGKPVVVRAKVTKVNNGILGHNWLHVQDGTGAAGTNDLIVTTAATVARGDVVVIRGTVAVDKDFGAGYRYSLLVEDATVASK